MIERGGPTVRELLDARRDTLAMDHRQGLCCEGIPLAAIADATGTPAWVIGAATIRARYRRLARAMSEAGLGRNGIHYAVKANDHLAVLSVLAREGAGADVVSGGELRRARAAGVPPDRIVFSGVGKTADELALAVATGIAAVHVESAEELAALSAIATAAGRTQDVALRINPDIDAGGHDKISTGRAGDKFGIPLGDAVATWARAAALPGIRPVGLACHVGSQIDEPATFAAAASRLASVTRALRGAGHAVRILDVGGGLAVGYGVGARDADPDAVARAIAAVLAPLELEVAIEPGRWLVAGAGLLLASVVRRKQVEPHPFIILDAAMNDLARPALYGAWHGILPVAPWPEAADEIVEVVGPVCESGDVLAPSRLLPRLAPPARVAILDTGAYGAVMSSAYNARPFAPVVMIDNGAFHVVRPRQPVENLWAAETVPPAGPAEGRVS